MTPLALKTAAVRFWTAAVLTLASPGQSLIYPLRLAKKPTDSTIPGRGHIDQEALMNQWLATDAALRLRKGHPVDVDELNRFLIGCTARVRDHGVLELTFDSGLKALVCAGEDGPFRMRRAGYVPRHMMMVMIGRTHVWYAQEGNPKPPSNGGGALILDFGPGSRGMGDKLKMVRALKTSA